MPHLTGMIQQPVVNLWTFPHHPHPARFLMLALSGSRFARATLSRRERAVFSHLACGDTITGSCVQIKSSSSHYYFCFHPVLRSHRRSPPPKPRPPEHGPAIMRSVRTGGKPSAWNSDGKIQTFEASSEQDSDPFLSPKLLSSRKQEPFPWNLMPKATAVAQSTTSSMEKLTATP